MRTLFFFPYQLPGKYLLVKNSSQGHGTIIFTTHYCFYQLGDNNYTMNMEMHFKKVMMKACLDQC